MGVKDYGVLRGRIVATEREDGADTPHYQVRVTADETDYRLAVNVESQLSPSELLFVVIEDFAHPLTEKLPDLAEGFTLLPRQAGSAALDFIRGNLFNRLDMRLLPASLPGDDNDLSDRLAHYADRAASEADAEVYAFGSRWGPEPGDPDQVFDFDPGNGVHDIHMNQGNDPSHRGDDGVWQDGGLIFRFPATDQWVAVFLAFQSQAWHTDDATGHTLGETDPGEPDFRIRIVAALVNPIGPAPPDPIDLSDWHLVDKVARAQTLRGEIGPGEAKVVAIVPPVALGNSGGAISLLDAAGLKVDGVAYTKAAAEPEGWTIVF